ncbi:zinc finger protein 26-like [Anopheles aquasalis]|uniref:zinc finger protein 26-like n=1 Tax=Anopheles aquasalis TaxID=42839 RepID=UPI00215B3935|nr:zinc finger protein 26-like [Anopheles aquasalis]
MLENFCRICLTTTGVEYSIDETIDGRISLYAVVCNLCPDAFPESREWSRKICKQCRQRILNVHELYDLCQTSIGCFEELVCAKEKQSASESFTEEEPHEPDPDLEDIDLLEEDEEIVRSCLGLNRIFTSEEANYESVEQTHSSQQECPSVSEDTFFEEPSHDQEEFDSIATGGELSQHTPQDAFIIEENDDMLLNAAEPQEDVEINELVDSIIYATVFPKSKEDVKIDDLVDSIICATVFDDEVPELQRKESHRCKLCEDEVFSSAILLNNHMKESHLDVIFHCTPCDRVFTDKETYITHARSHSAYRDCFCFPCEKGFGNPRALMNHIQSHEHSCICPFCGMKIDNHMKLEVHIKSHYTVKPFACHLCPLRFHLEARLKEHLKRHEGEGNFRCEICGKRLNTQRNLKIHRRTVHTDRGRERPYGCDVCEKRFDTKSKLRCHVRTHTGEKPFACMFCEKRYAENGDLKCHLRKHLGDNIYQCDRCDASFRLIRELRQHYAVHADGSDSMGRTDFRFTLEYIVNLRLQKGLSKLDAEENESSIK